MREHQSKMFVDTRRGLVVIEETLDDAESLACMLPGDDGFTRDLWATIEELRASRRPPFCFQPMSADEKAEWDEYIAKLPVHDRAHEQATLQSYIDEYGMADGG